MLLNNIFSELYIVGESYTVLRNIPKLYQLFHLPTSAVSSILILLCNHWTVNKKEENILFIHAGLSIKGKYHIFLPVENGFQYLLILKCCIRYISPRFLCRPTGYFELAVAVGRQSALHNENSGFSSASQLWHISTFCGYQILFSI